MKLLKLLILLLPLNIVAEPWIDTSNLFLRENIQRLADAGYIKTPVTSFPLMWEDIASDIKKVNVSELNQSNKNAYYYIKHQLKLAKKSQRTIEVNIATEQSRFSSFGDNTWFKNSIWFHKTFMSGNFAAKLSPSIVSSSISDDKTHFDGSYLAAFYGNWIASIGMQDRWWGPGWDSNLSLTNNARPMPAIALTRKSALPVNIPFTKLQVPWTMTTFMGIMNDKRVINDALLWGFRLNFKPIKNLEIGLTRLAQWGGDSRPQDASTFWKVLIGQDNCGANGLNCDNTQEPGNQQAGYYLRYSFNLFETPFSLYGQYFAEDGNNEDSLSFLTEPQVQIGFDSQQYIFNVPTSIYLEYSDTFADCSDTNEINIGDCFYEHHIYQTGMRYQQRTIGNLYDNDAKSIILGAIVNLNINTKLEVKIRHLELNADNHDKALYNPIIGNSLTKISEDMIMLSGKLQYSYKNWRFTVSADASQSKFENAPDKENKANIHFKLEYNI